MVEDMRVTLLHYDVNRVVNEPGNKTVMKHFGHMPNIQLLYVAAVLERLGVDLQYLDVVGMELGQAELESRLKHFQPELIGMSVYTSHFHTALEYAAYLKSLLPQSKIMLGGVHTQIFPTETLEYNPHVDFACVGEAEMVLPEFVSRWRKGESFQGMPGLVWRDDGQVRYQGPPELCRDLDAVPFPARHLVPNHKYYNFISTWRNYTVFNTSRGCPFRCLFCEAAGQKWRARSAPNVVDEFEEVYERFGVREVDIFDSSFTISKKRVLEICAGLVQRGLHRKMIWNVRSRVDTIDEEMLEALREAGCYRIFYGIESGNPEVLEKLRKMTNLARIEEIVRATNRMGISAFGYFLIGCPGDTEDTVRQTIDFAKRLPLDFAIFNALTPFPKTALYEDYYLPAVQRDFWSDYIRNPRPLDEFVGRPWTELSDSRVRRMAHRAMLEYYFRPIQLWRAIRSVASWDQFWRYCRAGWDMSLGYLRQWLGLPLGRRGE